MLKNVQVLGHNSIRFQGETVIYVDPFRIQGKPGDGALIFITHEHYDHFSPEDIKKVMGPDALLVMPESMREVSENVPEEKIFYVEPGKQYKVKGISFETLRAYNQDKNFHPMKKDWIGYILTLWGKRYYIAGDTDAVPEAEKVKCDVAFLPVGGTYTMDYRQAADLARKIRPAVAVPVHYGSIVGERQDGNRFLQELKGEISCQVLIP